MLNSLNLERIRRHMQTLRARYASRSDLPQIVDIYNATIPLRTVTADLEPVSVESRVAWFECHNETRHPLWIFEDADSGLIGWASFQAFYERKAYDSCVEVSIYLSSKAQGKGYGSEILNFCLSEARQRRIRTLLGFIFKNNSASVRLFEKSGFEPWGKFPEIAEMGDHFEDLLIFGKRI